MVYKEKASQTVIKKNNIFHLRHNSEDKIKGNAKKTEHLNIKNQNLTESDQISEIILKESSVRLKPSGNP